MAKKGVVNVGYKISCLNLELEEKKIYSTKYKPKTIYTLISNGEPFTFRVKNLCFLETSSGHKNDAVYSYLADISKTSKLSYLKK